MTGLINGLARLRCTAEHLSERWRSLQRVGVQIPVPIARHVDQQATATVTAHHRPSAPSQRLAPGHPQLATETTHAQLSQRKSSNNKRNVSCLNASKLVRACGPLVKMLLPRLVVVSVRIPVYHNVSCISCAYLLRLLDTTNYDNKSLPRLRAARHRSHLLLPSPS